jgi:PAS domain-containing protein
MPQQPVELILMRQLATYLSMPVFLVGADEQLLYYNEAAEVLLGRPYSEVGQMAVRDIVSIFHVVDEDGAPLAWERLPIAIAVRERRPAHRRVHYHALDGVRHHIEVTAFPLEGQAGRHLGAVAIFWEVNGA